LPTAEGVRVAAWWLGAGTTFRLTDQLDRARLRRLFRLQVL